MPYQLDLNDALDLRNVEVAEHRGWQTRGSSRFAPRGVVCHHTGPGSVEGLIRLCIHGRRDLPGPLANVVLAPNGVAHLIAAGRANHAGRGGWRGLSGNSSVFGIEAIHPGDTSPWPDVQMEAYYRVVAAMLDLAGEPVEMCCAHKEWAPGRKPDPAGINMDAFRQAVATIIRPTPTLPEGVPMANAPFAALLVHPDGGYLEVGEDGGIFAWGGCPFFGSLGDQTLNEPIIDAAWTPTYQGYYLLGRDGGVFAFGDARHQGNALWSR